MVRGTQKQMVASPVGKGQLGRQTVDQFRKTAMSTGTITRVPDKYEEAKGGSTGGSDEQP